MCGGLCALARRPYIARLHVHAYIYIYISHDQPINQSVNLSTYETSKSLENHTIICRSPGPLSNNYPKVPRA